MNSLSHFWCLPDLAGRPPGKVPVQQLEIRDQILLCPSPVRQFLAAGSTHLIPKELDQTFVNPVIVWLHDTLAVFVAKPQQMFFLNGRPDEWIDVRVDFRPPWVPSTPTP
jgi:hypothetical protein